MIEQVGIAIFGVSAVFLSQCKTDSLRRWACIFGLVGQPFWLYATWRAEQWGIFVLCFIYTYSWARGIKTFWMKR